MCQVVPPTEAGRPLTDREKLTAANTLATFKFNGTMPIFDVTIFTLIRGRTSDTDEIPTQEGTSVIDGRQANALEVPPISVSPCDAEAQQNPLPNDAYPQDAFTPEPIPWSESNPTLNIMPPQSFQEFLREMPPTLVSPYHTEAQHNPLPHGAYPQEAFSPYPIPYSYNPALYTMPPEYFEGFIRELPPTFISPDHTAAQHNPLPHDAYSQEPETFPHEPNPYPYNPALNIMLSQSFQEFLRDHTTVLPNSSRAQPVALSHDIQYQQDAFSPQRIPPGSNPAWNVVPPPSLPQYPRDRAAYSTQASYPPVPNQFVSRGSSLSPPTSQSSPGSSTSESSSNSSSESSLCKRRRDTPEGDDGTPASEPFICEWGGCGAKISYVPHSDAGGVPEVVRRHVTDHFPKVPKDTPVRCHWESCNTVINRDNLRKHILVHMSLFHFKCRGCLTSYQRSEKWFAHVEKCARFEAYLNSSGKARPVKTRRVNRVTKTKTR